MIYISYSQPVVVNQVFKSCHERTIIELIVNPSAVDDVVTELKLSADFDPQVQRVSLVLGRLPDQISLILAFLAEQLL